MLGIRLSNGHEFRYMIASGGLAYDGRGWPWDQPFRWVGLLDESLFTTVIKTLTLEPRQGNFRWWNPLGSLRFIRNGVVNAYGLTNPGCHWWCQNVGPAIDSSRAAIVGSIFGQPNELAKMAAMLNDYDLVALEVNASCPNVDDGVLLNCDDVIRGLEAAKRASRFPLISKLSVTHDAAHVIPRITDLVEAVNINSVPWETAFPGRKSPLAHLGGGGVSGKAAQPFTWKMVDELAAQTDIPIIAPSVWEYGDIERLVKRGARAVSFGAVLMFYPWRPTLIVREHMRT